MLVGNPHLRAKFAQLLALMIPPDEEEQGHGRNAIKDSWVGVAVYNESMLSFFAFSPFFHLFLDTYSICVQFLESQRSLFESHSLACKHLVEALLIIFIDIEFTGDSMEFEAKFGMTGVMLHLFLILFFL